MLYKNKQLDINITGDCRGQKTPNLTYDDGKNINKAVSKMKKNQADPCRSFQKAVQRAQSSSSPHFTLNHLAKLSDLKEQSYTKIYTQNFEENVVGLYQSFLCLIIPNKSISVDCYLVPALN